MTDTTKPVEPVAWQRYDPVHDYQSCWMSKFELGEYVEYDEAYATLDAANTEIERLTKELESACEHLALWCQRATDNLVRAQKAEEIMKKEGL